jgi:ubiquinone/menaquinone biosynthesis C-methylase UbiE
MKSAKTFFDKFSKQYEAENRYKYQWYRWTVDNVIKQIDREKPVILDLGTGNGEIATRAALKFPHSSVIGIDVSSGMINEAEEKARKMGLKNVRFVVSPMENLNRKSRFCCISPSLSPCQEQTVCDYRSLQNSS